MQLDRNIGTEKRPSVWLAPESIDYPENEPANHGAEAGRAITPH